MRSKGERWREARVKTLQAQIRACRKKIAFWKSMGASENHKRALREMISLKSKLADVRKPR